MKHLHRVRATGTSSEADRRAALSKRTDLSIPLDKDREWELRERARADKAHEEELRSPSRHRQRCIDRALRTRSSTAARQHTSQSSEDDE